MGLENSNLNILIKTAAELAGAEQAAAALERDIGKAKALGQEYGHLEAKLKTARAAIAEYNTAQIGVGKAGVEAATAATAATQADTEATKEAALGKHELKAALKVLGHEFGALKGITRFLFNPTTLGIFALYQAYEAIHKMVEKSREWKETLESHVDLSGMVAGLGEGVKKIDEAKVHTAEFFNEFERRSKDTKGFKDKADEIIKQLQRVAEEEKKLADAEAKRDLARLELLKATKKISGEDYEAGKAAIEQNLIGKKSAIGKDLDKKTAAELASAASQADFFIATNTGKVGPANQAAQEAARRREDLKKQQESALKLAEAHLKQLEGEGEGKDKKTGLIEKYEQFPAWMREVIEGGKTGEWFDKNAGPNANPFTKAAPATQEQVLKARSGEAGAMSTARQRKGQIPDAEIAAKQAEAEAKDLQKKIDQAQKDRQAIEEELKRRQADTAATAPITAAADAANSEAARVSAEAKAEEARQREAEKAAREKDREDRRRARANDRDVNAPDADQFRAEDGGDFSGIPTPPADGMVALNEAWMKKFSEQDARLAALAASVGNLNSRTRDDLSA
ncbi:MAG: hypothetical protein NTZ16_12425 [Verrucomicrobia bacterium]|nr:hypothetical protein [Verrucomicrobiota bacterium]